MIKNQVKVIFSINTPINTQQIYVKGKFINFSFSNIKNENQNFAILTLTRTVLSHYSALLITLSSYMCDGRHLRDPQRSAENV